MRSEIFHKNELERYGLAKSKQVEGATVNIKGEMWKIMHICHNKDYSDSTKYDLVEQDLEFVQETFQEY